MRGGGKIEIPVDPTRFAYSSSSGNAGTSGLGGRQWQKGGTAQEDGVKQHC